MKDLDIWTYLQHVQQELKHGLLDTQDKALNDLQHHLDKSCLSLFPSILYPQLVHVLSYYCTDILPHLKMSDEDQRFVRESFEHTL